MTAAEFRRLALALPETEERAHMNHPDFRVGGRIFATLGYPDEGWGMVKLFPDQQAEYVAADPKMFVPVKGAWGRQGGTNVRLKAASQERVREALRTAWRNTAPKKLVELESASGAKRSPARRKRLA